MPTSLPSISTTACHKSGSRCAKRFVGVLGLFDGEAALLHLHLCFTREPQNRSAGDAVQDVVGEVPRDDRAVLDDIGVVGRALVHEAILGQPRIIVSPLCLGFHLGERREQELHSLDVTARPALVFE